MVPISPVLEPQVVTWPLPLEPAFVTAFVIMEPVVLVWRVTCSTPDRITSLPTFPGVGKIPAKQPVQTLLPPSTSDATALPLPKFHLCT